MLWSFDPGFGWGSESQLRRQLKSNCSHQEQSIWFSKVDWIRETVSGRPKAESIVCVDVAFLTSAHRLQLAWPHLQLWSALPCSQKQTLSISNTPLCIQIFMTVCASEPHWNPSLSWVNVHGSGAVLFDFLSFLAFSIGFVEFFSWFGVVTSFCLHLTCCRLLPAPIRNVRLAISWIAPLYLTLLASICFYLKSSNWFQIWALQSSFAFRVHDKRLSKCSLRELDARTASSANMESYNLISAIGYINI